jgi:glutathione S-transferase
MGNASGMAHSMPRAPGSIRAMRRLYHFPLSPFSRRVRLALAHKRLEVALIDPRTEPERRAEVNHVHPLQTVPVLVEDDGFAIGDSLSITRYLDCAYPEGPIWPTEPTDARRDLRLTALVDGALHTLVDLGTRYHLLSTADVWASVSGMMMTRVQAALDEVGQRAHELPAGRWSAAEMWLLTAVSWLEGLPARASSFPPASQIVALGWKLPPALSEWARPRFAEQPWRALEPR